MVEQTRLADLESLERELVLAQAARSHAALLLDQRDTFDAYVHYVCAVSTYQVAFKKFTSVKRMKQNEHD